MAGTGRAARHPRAAGGRQFGAGSESHPDPGHDRPRGGLTGIAEIHFMSRTNPKNPRPRAVVNGPATPYANARISAERVEMALRTRFDPLPTLNPQRLVQSLQQFERGYLDPAARTWEAMERRDDRLASVSAKAKSALARYGFEVRLRPNLPLALREEAAKHQAALEHLYTHCTVTNAVREDESGGFSLLVRQMADAIGKRYSVHEILWEPGVDGTLTATFRHAPLWFFEATSGKLRYKLQEGAATGVDLDPDAWLVTVGDGIMEACSVLWVYKHLPLRDWLAYSEKFGMPYLLGKTQAIFNSQEWLAMVAALRGFGSDGAAVVGGADDIVPVAVGASSEATPFPGLVERSERAMSILWRGADLGTQAHSGSGQGQGASLQGDETAALDEDRAAWLSESLSAVSRTAIKYLFGEGVQPLAYVRLKTAAGQDVGRDLAVDTFLLSSGAPLSVADVLARYHRPMPAAGELLLQPPGSAGGSGDGGGAKAAASEEATLASIERAANAAMARVLADNYNHIHDKLGRFATRNNGASPIDKDTPEPGSAGEKKLGGEGAKIEPDWSDFSDADKKDFEASVKKYDYAADKDSVGSHLDIRADGDTAKQIDLALQVLHSVHTDGGLPDKLPVNGVLTIGDRNAVGRYRFDTKTGIAQRIDIKVNGIAKAFTTLHEIAHLLHQQIFSEQVYSKYNNHFSSIKSNRKAIGDLSGLQLSQFMIGPHYTDDEMDAMSAKIDLLKRMVDLQEILEDTPEVKKLKANKKPSGEFADNIKELQKNPEIWARAYVQYIAQKSGNPELLAALHAKRDTPVGQMLNRYWSDENFRPVAKGFDDLFRSKGWLREQ